MDDLQFLHDSFDTFSKSLNEQNFPEIFLIEDDLIFGKTIKRFLEKKLRLKINYFSSPGVFLDHITANYQETYCLITDISFNEEGIDGLLLIDVLRERGHSFASIAMTGFASIETAIAATKKGVFHYLTKPFGPQILVDLVLQVFKEKFKISSEDISNNAIGQVSSRASKSHLFRNEFKIEPPNPEDIFCGMIGRSKKMKDVFERIKKVAASDSTVLITGPSGTGKELVANAIHGLSTRHNKKMVSVNCGAIPGELLESELFGHVKGAFTGAITDRDGRFLLADKGTIFLDEIGDMPLLLQVKILRVLQNKEITKVGSTKTIDLNVRVVTATNRNLEKSVTDGDFREDLYYRLNVIPLKIPSLSERRDDIPLLVSYFLSKFVSADGRNNIEFNSAALEFLIGYEWPGNVRELENLIERLVILRSGNVIRPEDLPAKFFRNNPHSYAIKNMIDLPDNGIDLKNTLGDIENSLIIQALDKTNGNKNQASKLLHINRTTLIEKMKKKGLIV